MACIDALGRDRRRLAAADALGRVVVPGRMQRVDAGQDFLAVVDYAHKPAALAAVLDAIRAAWPVGSSSSSGPAATGTPASGR